MLDYVMLHCHVLDKHMQIVLGHHSQHGLKRPHQVAMITLHSSAPWLPVCLGSLVAFLLLTFSAVAAATLVQHAKLSERFVLGVSAVSFFVFAALAVHDGVVAEA